MFAWVSMDVVLQTVASTLVSATVYLGHSYYSFPLSDGVTSPRTCSRARCWACRRAATQDEFYVFAA